MDTNTVTEQEIALQNAQEARDAKRDALDKKIAELREFMGALNAERTETLPRISAAELKLVVKATEDVEVRQTHLATVAKLKQNRQFSEEDKDQLAAAKITHRQLINEPEIKAEAMAHLAKAYLQSYRLVHKKSGKTGLTIKGEI